MTQDPLRTSALAETAGHIIRQLLDLSRPTAAEHAACDLREVVQQALKLVELRLNEADIPLTVNLPSASVIVKGDTQRLNRSS